MENLPPNPNHASPSPSSSNSTDTQIHLTLTSYAHAHGPLRPAPDLSYDLRALPNPPKAVRSVHTGQSKELQDWLFEDPDVTERIVEIHVGIQTLLEQVSADSSNTDDDEEMKRVSVGIFCERGKHRSVAVVEELAKKEWGDEVEVAVVHRDVQKDRKAGKSGREKSGGKGRRMSRGGFVGFDED